MIAGRLERPKVTQLLIKELVFSNVSLIAFLFIVNRLQYIDLSIRIQAVVPFILAIIVIFNKQIHCIL